MGCWGVTAMQSDDGLDAVDFIRKHLPSNGCLDLGKTLELLQNDRSSIPDDVKEGRSHTSPMALAEIMVLFLEGNAKVLDYEGEWASTDNKFQKVVSFAASKESVEWVRNYLVDTLKYARINAETDVSNGRQPGGWFDYENWLGWQKHMEFLIERMNDILAMEGGTQDLLSLGAESEQELRLL